MIVIVTLVNITIKSKVHVSLNILGFEEKLHILSLLIVASFAVTAMLTIRVCSLPLDSVDGCSHVLQHVTYRRHIDVLLLIRTAR